MVGVVNRSKHSSDKRHHTTLFFCGSNVEIRQCLCQSSLAFAGPRIGRFTYIWGCNTVGLKPPSGYK